MKLPALFVLSSVALSFVVKADVTFNIGAIGLKDQFGDPLTPGSGLILFAGSTDNGTGFAEPTATQFFPGPDDILLDYWVYSETDPGEFGQVTSETLGPLGFTTGDFLRLYWFPDLTISDLGTVTDGKPSGQPGAGTFYGVFPPIGQDTGTWPTDWITPGDGNTISPTFEAPGDGPGNASNFTPVPEPSFYAGAFAVGCLAWAAISKKRKERNLA